MKLCKDCKHLGKSPWGSMDHCKRGTGVNLRDGSQKCVDICCESERSTGWLASTIFGFCGKEGRFFEEKDDAND